MSYKISKGGRKFGDITAEGDSDTKIDFETDTINLVAGGNTNVSVTDDQTILLHTSSSTNAPPANAPVLVAHSTSGTAAAGFGTALGFSLENASGALHAAAAIGVGWTTATSGYEDAVMSFTTQYGGASHLGVMLSEYGMTIQSGNMGAITTPATQGLSVKTNRYADWGMSLFNDGNNAYHYGMKIQTGTDAGLAVRLIGFYDGDGDIAGYISQNSGTVSYNAFTGAHPAAVQNQDYTPGQDAYAYGTIVKVISAATGNGAKQVVYGICPTSSANDKSVMGVYSNNADPEELSNQNEHTIFAIGDGHVLVCDEGGNIEVGDYIPSSSTLGHGMKQSDDIMRNYTVAKATQAVDWSQESESTKLICCTYHAA